ACPPDRTGGACARARLTHLCASRRAGLGAAAGADGAGMSDRQRIVFLGLTITSTWGNGHATTYRGLVRELARRRHQVTFLERDASWYSNNRDLPKPPYGTTLLYGSVDELRQKHADLVSSADLVIVGSYVPD